MFTPKGFGYLILYFLYILYVCLDRTIFRVQEMFLNPMKMNTNVVNGIEMKHGLPISNSVKSHSRSGDHVPRKR